MNILAWVLQAMLAFYYLCYSVVLVVPPEPMRAEFLNIPFWFRAFVAIVAAACAAGIVLPSVIKNLGQVILPASMGLMVIAGGETLYRFMRHEALPAKVRGVLFVMSLVVVFVRWWIPPVGGSAVSKVVN